MRSKTEATHSRNRVVTPRHGTAPETSTWKRSNEKRWVGVRSNERQQRLHEEEEDGCEAERRLHTLVRSHHQMAKNWVRVTRLCMRYVSTQARPHVGAPVVDEAARDDQLGKCVARVHGSTNLLKLKPQRLLRKGESAQQNGDERD